MKDGVWQANSQLKTASFDPVSACALRFTAKEGTGDAADRSYACAAEIDVLLAESPATCVISAYAQPGEGGTVSVSQSEVPAGQPVTFTAQENTGWSFTGWYDLLGNPVSQETSYTLRPQSGVTLIARFVQDHQHTYGEPEFRWSQDGKSCTVVFTCTEDESHVTELQAEVSSKVTQEATCTQKGVTTYTASVTFQNAPYTDTKAVEDIPALGHKYENGVCIRCGEKDPDATELTAPTKPTDPSEPTEPSETTQPTEKPTTEPTKPATDPDGPDQTGERVDGVLLAVLTLVSAACLGITVLYTYRQKVR